MLDVLNDSANIGITVLGSGAGIRFLVSGVRIFIKDIFPLLKPQQTTDTEHSPCIYHRSMDQVVKRFEDSSTLLIRIETKLDASIQAHSAHDKCIDEIYTRLRANETEIAVVKSKLE